jgi:hypothetical protein
MDGILGRISVSNQLPSRKSKCSSGYFKPESKDFCTSHGARSKDWDFYDGRID